MRKKGEESEKIINFFCDRVAKRVRDRKTEKRLTREEIYSADVGLVSRIINGKRGVNNKFLVTDTILGDVDSKEGLVPKLEFDSKTVLLWGTLEERREYMEDLFILCFEICNESFSESERRLLCGEVEYSKNETYVELLFESKEKYPALYWGIYEDTVLDPNRRDSIREKALHRFYKKCENQFEKLFNDYADKTPSFKSLDRKFRENFIDDNFSKLLDEMRPTENEIGMYVRLAIIHQLKSVPRMIEKNNGITEVEEIQKLMNYATSQYITQLEIIQDKLEENSKSLN